MCMVLLFVGQLLTSGIEPVARSMNNLRVAVEGWRFGPFGMSGYVRGHSIGFSSTVSAQDSSLGLMHHHRYLRTKETSLASIAYPNRIRVALIWGSDEFPRKHASTIICHETEAKVHLLAASREGGRKREL